MTSSLVLSGRDARITLPTFHLVKTWRPAGLRLPAHSHRHTNLALCASGTFDELVGRRWYRVTPASLIIRPGGESHANDYAHGPSRAIVFELRPEAVHALETATAVVSSVRYLESNAVVGFVRRLTAELARRDSVSSLALEGLLFELVVLASRQEVPAGHRPPWLETIVDFLDANFARRISMSELSAVADIHATHIARTFRATHRMTVAAYVRQLRISRSAALLRQTDRPLADIAVQCGFYDQSHFTRAFRRQLGVSPHRFRRQAR